jgi:hypothetical protein
MSNSNTCYRKTDKDCNLVPTGQQPISLNPNVSSDVFSNEFHNLNQQYKRRDSDCLLVTQPLLNGRDYVRQGTPFLFDAAAWERKDKDCNTVTQINPNSLFSVYAPRDYQARDKDNNPRSTICPIPLTVTSPVGTVTIDISDYEFILEGGELVAREEGYSYLLEPEVLTVLNI